jgi:hypothetical protein
VPFHLVQDICGAQLIVAFMSTVAWPTAIPVTVRVLRLRPFCSLCMCHVAEKILLFRPPSEYMVAFVVPAMFEVELTRLMNCPWVSAPSEAQARQERCHPDAGEWAVRSTLHLHSNTFVHRDSNVSLNTFEVPLLILSVDSGAFFCGPTDSIIVAEGVLDPANAITVIAARRVRVTS